MMSGLFLLYFGVIVLALLRYRLAALVGAFFVLALCIVMFLHHATDALGLRF